jgi:uroporphyrinogen decarboxylase
LKLAESLSRDDRTPVVPLLGYPGVVGAGLSAEQALTDVPSHMRSLQFLVERFDPACLFYIMDLTVEAEAVGARIEFGEAGPPSVAEHPVGSFEDLEKLSVPNPADHGRMPLFNEVVAAMSERFDCVVGAYGIGPFTLAAELVGAEELAVRAVTEPEFARAVIDFCRAVTRAYTTSLAISGAQVIAILEPTAVILSPAMFDDLCVGPLTSVAEVIKAEGAHPVLHICGDSTHLLPGMVSCGVQGLSLDSPVDLEVALDVAPYDMLVIGNVDPVGVMVEGTVDEVSAAAHALLQKFARFPNYVLSSGCDLPAETPLENIDALMSAVIP